MPQARGFLCGRSAGLYKARSKLAAERSAFAHGLTFPERLISVRINQRQQLGYKIFRRVAVPI